MTEQEAPYDLSHITTNLRRQIEELADGYYLYGDRAYTPRHTAYTVVMNGCRKAEGEIANPPSEPYAMAQMALLEARKLRDAVPGEAYLVWRHLPEFDASGALYMRLCFEPRWPEVPVYKQGSADTSRYAEYRK